jgi:hypothetical protein
MSIKDRNLKPGTHLTGRYHKQSYSCEVIEGEEGKLRYRLADGREFKSPSAAGMAITGHACDGWVFWSVAPVEAAQTPPVQGGINAQRETVVDATAPEANAPAAEPQGSTVSNSVAAAETGPAKKTFKRTPNQKGVLEGQTRWYCQECGESFMAPYGEIPPACPMGHKA